MFRGESDPDREPLSELWALDGERVWFSALPRPRGTVLLSVFTHLLVLFLAGMR